MAKIERIVIPAVVQVVEPEKEVFKLELSKDEIKLITEALGDYRGFPAYNLYKVFIDI